MPAQHQQQWQPSSLLPDLASAGGMQQLVQLKEEAQQLPTDALVVLVRGVCSCWVVSVCACPAAVLLLVRWRSCLWLP